MKTDPIQLAINRLPPILRQDVEKNLCTCNDVPKLDIIKAIVAGATSVEAVRKETYATMGSGCCIQQVERLIECICKPEMKKRRSKKNQ
ncbi:MAG: (2Fe-2S)-binding protein [Gammaproteobacteria bacterium]|nr:(2Fe-2S)-binding protein [Gammaproteobacteria bacterium]